MGLQTWGKIEFLAAPRSPSILHGNAFIRSIGQRDSCAVARLPNSCFRGGCSSVCSGHHCRLRHLRNIICHSSIKDSVIGRRIWSRQVGTQRCRRRRRRGDGACCGCRTVRAHLRDGRRTRRTRSYSVH